MALKEITAKLETIGKSMETNLKYQILTVGLFFAISQGTYQENAVSILGTDIPISILLIACPVIFIYLLARFAIDTSFFFVTNNLLVNEINLSKINNEELRIHYPMSLFVTLTLSTELTINRGRRLINKLLSTIIFIVPGINVGIGFYILLNFMAKEYQTLFWIFLILGLIVYITVLVISLIKERKVYLRYFHVPITVLLASITTLIFLSNNISLSDILKNNKENASQFYKFPNHH
ncbi:hypothetical protein [Flavivirga jejuensis]|uniref:Uncharacterized protein n=1 Tax=Flavivirga jejuensis TaxID=870487 RepID=A0ABT8WSF3_9FLAO|nr:hypothetical protein [Flavivirga jejuensis]MDO5976086.1 hypothetical protein [Flavivirga jejuensis]